MIKTVHPGYIQVNQKTHDVTCTIEFKHGRLSISGEIGHISSGQIDGDFAHRNPAHDDARHPKLYRVGEDFTLNPGWDEEKWYAFLECWSAYHLNDMQTCCEHQREFGWDTERIDPSRPASEYDDFGEGKRTWNLKIWAYPPLGYLTKPCPICGYKAGTAWLTKPVPTDVIEFLFSLE